MELVTPEPPPPEDSLCQNMASVPVEKVNGRARHAGEDVMAVEEPLEIRLAFRRDSRQQQKSISITMRTPGHDFDLACGFLLTEGIIRGPQDIAAVKHCGVAVGPLRLRNTVRVSLQPDVELDFERLQRHFYTSSSCGVCGKTSIAALSVSGVRPLAGDGPRIAADVFHRLPVELRRSQDVFDLTGGLHAAALFDTAGRLICVREDVGRHNAVDKLIGSELMAGRLPLDQQILLVSGRASFELVQKALVARLPIMAAVGAPSSLAVELASHNGMTLLGFLRSGRFNIYSGGQRVIGPLGS